MALRAGVALHVRVLRQQVSTALASATPVGASNLLAQLNLSLAQKARRSKDNVLFL